MLGLLATKVFADGTEGSGGYSLIYKLNATIVNPIIQLLFAIAFLVFLFGIVEFFFGSGNADKVEKGKRHMLTGVIGLFIMIAAFGIINLFLNFIGATPV